MAMAVAISPGILILLLYLQNTSAQQCSNNGFKSSPGLPQQNFQKSPCGLNQIAQNGLNFNSPQQGNTQQVNYLHQPNIQQGSLTQASNQPQLNLQQGNSQPLANSMSNSQLLKQPNQDLAANIFSTLYNIKQSAQNQRATCSNGKGNPSQQNYEQLQYQNQPNPSLTVSAPINKPQTTQPSISNLISEYSQFLPGFTFQFVPNNNVPVQSNQQMFALPVQKVSTNDQNQNYSIQSQPATSSVPSHQAKELQSPVMIPATQSSTAQNQPIVLTFQSPQIQTVQNQPTLSTTQTSHSQPIIYTVQTQPSSALSQNQQISEVPNQNQIVNNPPMDKQSLISYVTSRMQNPQGSGNMLASILPAALNTKSEKSSSMKTLLPLILNLLNDKKSCCGCPHCGCNNGQPKPEPIISTGYSSHINYSQQKPTEVLAKMTEYIDKSVDSISNDTKQEKTKVVENTNNSAKISEEDETEANDSEEEYDDE